VSKKGSAKVEFTSTGGGAQGKSMKELAAEAAKEVRPPMVHIGAPAPSMQLTEAAPQVATLVTEQAAPAVVTPITVSSRLNALCRNLHGAEQAAVNGVLVDLEMARFKAREAAASSLFNEEEIALLREIAEL